MTGNANAARLWILGSIVAAIGIVLIFWLGLISPQLSDASSLRNQKADADTQNTLLAARIQRLQGADMNALRSQLDLARQALPGDSGLPEFTRQLSKDAEASLVKVTSITAAAPTTANAQPAAAVANSENAASTPATAPANQSAAGKVFAIPVTIIATGAPARLQTLIHKVQAEGPRRALVINATFAPANAVTTGGAGIASGATMTIQMQIFVAPQTPDAEAQLDRLAAGGR